MFICLSSKYVIILALAIFLISINLFSFAIGRLNSADAEELFPKFQIGFYDIHSNREAYIDIVLRPDLAGPSTTNYVKSILQCSECRGRFYRIGK